MSAAEKLDITPKVLSRSDILGSDDLPKKLVEVPEWGGSVYVRTMTGTERDAYEQSIMEIRGDKVTQNFKNIRAKLCARCICGEDGERLITETDVDALGRKSAKALDRVFKVAQDLNGMSDSDVEELAGN